MWITSKLNQIILSSFYILGKLPLDPCEKMLMWKKISGVSNYENKAPWPRFNVNKSLSPDKKSIVFFNYPNYPWFDALSEFIWAARVNARLALDAGQLEALFLSTIF